MAAFYFGRLENTEMCNKIYEQFVKIKGSLTKTNYILPHDVTDTVLPELVYFDIQHLSDRRVDIYENVKPVTYCIHAILTVDVLLRPWKKVSYFVSELHAIQRLKKYSSAELYYEIIRASFVTLSDVKETEHDTMWGAFIFFKVPQIIKQLHSMKKGINTEIHNIY